MEKLHCPIVKNVGERERKREIALKQSEMEFLRELMTAFFYDFGG